MNQALPVYLMCGEPPKYGRILQVPKIKHAVGCVNPNCVKEIIYGKNKQDAINNWTRRHEVNVDLSGFFRQAFKEVSQQVVAEVKAAKE